MWRAKQWWIFPGTPIGKFKRRYTHGGKRTSPNRFTLRWSSENTIRKLTTGLTLEHRERKIVLERNDSVTWKATRGASGMEASKTWQKRMWMIKGIDREKWVTISKIAIPLNDGTAVAPRLPVRACSRVSLIRCSANACVSKTSVHQQNPQRIMVSTHKIRLCQSTSVTKWWACSWTALRATVPWTNVFVAGSQYFPELSGAPPAPSLHRFGRPTQPWTQSFEHVLAHGCRIGDWNARQWSRAYQRQDVASSKRLDGSHDKWNVALARNGSKSQENAGVCSAISGHVHNRGHVWDKIATKRAARTRKSTLEEKYQFVTFVLGRMKLSVGKKKAKGLGRKSKTRHLKMWDTQILSSCHDEFCTWSAQIGRRTKHDSRFSSTCSATTRLVTFATLQHLPKHGRRQKLWPKLSTSLARGLNQQHKKTCEATLTDEINTQLKNWKHAKLINVLMFSTASTKDAAVFREQSRIFTLANRRHYQIIKGKKIIECYIENFDAMFAVAKQKAVPSVEFSKDEGNLKREKEAEDTILDLLQPFIEGFENTRCIFFISDSKEWPCAWSCRREISWWETYLGCHRCASRYSCKKYQE